MALAMARCSATDILRQLHKLLAATAGTFAEGLCANDRPGELPPNERESRGVELQLLLRLERALNDDHLFPTLLRWGVISVDVIGGVAERRQRVALAFAEVVGALVAAGGARARRREGPAVLRAMARLVADIRELLWFEDSRVYARADALLGAMAQAQLAAAVHLHLARPDTGLSVLFGVGAVGSQPDPTPRRR